MIEVKLAQFLDLTAFLFANVTYIDRCKVSAGSNDQEHF